MVYPMLHNKAQELVSIKTLLFHDRMRWVTMTTVIQFFKNFDGVQFHTVNWNAFFNTTLKALTHPGKEKVNFSLLVW